MDTKELPCFDSDTAFEGALRFLDCNDNSWKNRWGRCYGELMPNIKLIASDAFGTLYGVNQTDKVVIFWTETGEIEELDVQLSQFWKMIADDPENTISLGLYRDAVRKLGKPNIKQHFAFKVETALGGSLTVDNLTIMNADEHLQALGQIAQQIRDLPVGTELEPKD